MNKKMKTITILSLLFSVTVFAKEVNLKCQVEESWQNQSRMLYNDELTYSLEQLPFTYTGRGETLTWDDVDDAKVTLFEMTSIFKSTARRDPASYKLSLEPQRVSTLDGKSWGISTSQINLLLAIDTQNPNVSGADIYESIAVDIATQTTEQIKHETMFNFITVSVTCDKILVE